MEETQINVRKYRGGLSKKESLLSRSLGTRLGGGDKPNNNAMNSSAPDNLVHVISDGSEDEPHPQLRPNKLMSEIQRNQERIDDEILQRLDKEIAIDSSKISYPDRQQDLLRNDSGLQPGGNKVAFQQESPLSPPPHEVIDLESISSQHRINRLRHMETSSEFIVSSSSGTIPPRQHQVKNTIPADSFERFLSSLSKKYPEMTDRDRVLRWEVSDDVSDIEEKLDFSETLIKMHQNLKNRILKKNNEAPTAAVACSSRESNNRDAQAVQILPDKKSYQIVKKSYGGYNKSAEETEHRGDSVLLSINTQTQQVYTNENVLHSANHNKLSTPSGNPSNEEYVFKKKRHNQDINKEQRYPKTMKTYSKTSANKLNKVQENEDPTFKVPNVPSNGSKPSSIKNDISNKEEFYKYLGLGTKSPNDRSEDLHVEIKRRSLRVKLQQGQQQNSTPKSSTKEENRKKRNSTQNSSPLNGVVSSFDSNTTFSPQPVDSSVEEQQPPQVELRNSPKTSVNGNVLLAKPANRKRKNSSAERNVPPQNAQKSSTMVRVTYEKNNPTLISSPECPTVEKVAISDDKQNNEILPPIREMIKITYKKAKISPATTNSDKEQSINNVGTKALNGCTSSKTNIQNNTTKKSQIGSIIDISEDVRNITDTPKRTIDCIMEQLDEKFKSFVSSESPNTSSMLVRRDYVKGANPLSSPEGSIAKVDVKSHQSPINTADNQVLEEIPTSKANSDNIKLLKSPILAKKLPTRKYKYKTDKLRKTEIRKNRSKMKINRALRSSQLMLRSKKVIRLYTKFGMKRRMKRIILKPERPSESQHSTNKLLSPARIAEMEQDDELPPVKAAVDSERCKDEIILQHNVVAVEDQPSLVETDVRVSQEKPVESKDETFWNSIEQIVGSTPTVEDHPLASKEDIHVQEPVMNLRESTVQIERPNMDINCTDSYSTTLLNPLLGKHGAVLHAYYVQDMLVIVQEKKVSFWKYSTLIQMCGKSQRWEILGECPRKLYDDEVSTPYKNRICINETNPVYLEVRSRQFDQDQARECNMASVYVNVYYFNHWKADAVMHSVQLDTIRGLSHDICYTTITDSRYFIMCWKQEAPSSSPRTGLCKYSLTPDLDTLASIREFRQMRHVVYQIECLNDEKLIGFGEAEVTIWNHKTGDVLTNFDLKIPIGVNLGSIMQSIEFKDYLILYQSRQCDTTNVPELKILAVNLSQTPHSFRLIYTHELPQIYASLKTSLCTEEYIVAGNGCGNEILLLPQQPQRIFMTDQIASTDASIAKNPLEIVERFFSTGTNNFVEISKDHLRVKTIYEFLIDFKR